MSERNDQLTDDEITRFLRARSADAELGLLDEIVRAAGATPQDRPWLGRRPVLLPRRTLLIVALALLLATMGAIAVGSGRLVEPSPSVDLGIFEPVVGRIIYYTNSSLWGVDPSARSPGSTLVRLDLEGTAADGQFASFTVPLVWSGDGTELLFVRGDPNDHSLSQDRYLLILHADGSETQVTPEPVGGAAMSPDGSRVVFAADRDDGLYIVDAEGGQPVRIADGEEPTFSPDGTQIAYLSLPRSGCCVQAGREHVWVANADGTDAHEILAEEPALASGVFGLAWSPAGDRIAMENSAEGHVAIYTFAPDGSDFTEVITGGFNPHWSPDGSQIAYGVPGRDGLWIADADGSNVRTLDAGASGPWHPGPLEEDGEAPASSEEADDMPSQEAEIGCNPNWISASDEGLTVSWCPTGPDGQQARVAFRVTTTSAAAWLNGNQSRSRDALFFRPYGAGMQPGGTVAISVGGPATLEAWLALITGEAAYTVSEPQPISLGGADGYLVDVSMAPGHAEIGDAPPLIENDAESGRWRLGDSTSRIWLVDHEGQPVMFVTRPVGGDQSWARGIGDVLQTIEWD